MDRKMKMLYLSGAPRVSTSPDSRTPGPRAHILGVVGAARRAGVHTTTLIVGDSKFARKYLQNEGSESMGSGRLGYARDALRIVLRYVFALVAYWRRPQSPYFVYERFGMLQQGSLFLRRSADFIVTESNGIFFKEAAGDRGNLSLTNLARRWELKAYRESDLIVAVSDALATELCEIDPALSDKVAVVPNGVNTDFFSPADTPQRTDAARTIVWVGTLVAWQGVAELIEAYADLPDDVRCETRVIIVGDGPDLDRCMRLASRLAPGRVEFTGRLDADEVLRHLRAAFLAYSGHLKLEQSPMYHSPLKLYEYSSVGVPTIATESDDARNLLGPAGLSNLIFRSGDHESLVSAIASGLTLGTDATARAKLRHTIVENHSWDARFNLISDHVTRRVGSSDDRVS